MKALRGLLARKRIRTIAVLLAMLAVPGSLLGASPPASAAGQHLCEANGPHYCLGSANLNRGTHISARKPGRLLSAAGGSGTFEGYPTYKLKFSGTSKCVAGIGTGSSNIVKVEKCSARATVWALDVDSKGHLRWINRYDTLHNGGANDVKMFLAGPSLYDEAFSVLPRQGYYRFDWK